ncbi:MAG TPA: DUF2235 domain-containing protein [Allosphingosinicella sp.]|jgi:uncharacterized protein (DUF2235 family)
MGDQRNEAAAGDAAKTGPNGAAPAGHAGGAGAAKSIILFSDGTGNSSAKLFKTNVWRMYEAVDLGPATPGKRKQIAFYDNGVGTSGFKPLAILGGVFGIGLRQNVLDIYRYACRNYNPGSPLQATEQDGAEGDHIYGFGFSRGAFTMRTAIAMIAKVGLLETTREADLHQRSKEAWRAYRAGCAPRSGWSLWNLYSKLFRRNRARKDQDLLERLRAENYHPVIRFVGVWDTVAAYGGPIAEITRGIDNWIFPLGMPNYELSPHVRCARHALAIDDERDAFHPLLWDELAEEGLRQEHPAEKMPWLHPKPHDSPRLQQVWFTGMHADVGGGYPDESLSYVSFLWMKAEAEKAGLRTVKVITDRYRALANSGGPIHDSRSGAGVYYRYQPRNIGAWIHPADAESIVTDPELKDKAGKSKGLLQTAHVHESVLARIAASGNRYAPFGIPTNIKIVPPQPGGETAQQADTETPVAPPAEEQEARPMLSPELTEHLEDPIVGEARSKAMAAVWDHVWIRRITYFTTLFLTLALLLMPWWVELAPDPPFLADGRNWIGGVIRLLAIVTPAFLDPLIDTMADNAFYFLVIATAIGMLMWRTSVRERRLRDLCRAIWAESVDVGGPPPIERSPLWVRGLRTSKLYRRPMRILKWRVLPWLAALVITAFLLWLLVGLVVQIWLPFAERGAGLCERRPPHAEKEMARADFTPAATCAPVDLAVERDQRYIVEIDVVDSWTDGGKPADPAGLDAGEVGFSGYVGVPFRRVITADYLQPVAEIRTRDGGVHIQALEMRQQGDSTASWRGDFVAARNGALALFANEAVLPGMKSYFYDGGNYGNGGSACVTIRRAERAGDPAPLGRPGTVCATLDERTEADQLRRQQQLEARRHRPRSRHRPESAVPAAPAPAPRAPR